MCLPGTIDFANQHGAIEAASIRGHADFFCPPPFQATTRPSAIVRIRGWVVHHSSVFARSLGHRPGAYSAQSPRFENIALVLSCGSVGRLSKNQGSSRALAASRAHIFRRGPLQPLFWPSTRLRLGLRPEPDIVDCGTLNGPDRPPDPTQNKGLYPPLFGIGLADRGCLKPQSR